VDAFAKTLPPGTIHFISGSGRTTMPPLMKSGFIDGLGFIGGSKAADDLIRQHPHPHRLKLFLQLEAKNMGVRWIGTFSCLWCGCYNSQIVAHLLDMMFPAF
jgi:glyceraldehyde-3-phosphate dehydrogenase (NADP+)